MPNYKKAVQLHVLSFIVELDTNKNFLWKSEGLTREALRHSDLLRIKVTV